MYKSIKSVAAAIAVGLPALPALLAAQETGQIDTSKPTNLYSFLDNAFEVNTVDGDATTYGYRGILNLAPHDAHLFF